jgi:hypothetical protein
MRRIGTFTVVVVTVLLAAPLALASTPGTDVRLTHDDGSAGGYVSSYTIATGQPYTDPVLSECSRSRGRQNEPSVAVNPRNTNVLVGSSNDYCGVYLGSDPVGPIWLGYYRSENGGAGFVSSLVPGYPQDTSPFAALAEQVRTASAGDPVIAWDAQGRVFLGAESSDDPAGTAKTFGDVWVARYENPAGPGGATINDGKRYSGTAVVARGSSAPNLLGVFQDKTAIEADHNSDGRCDNDVYFSWSRFTGNAQTNAIYFARSTNHGTTFSNPMKLSVPVQGVQFADISVTGNSNVYVTFRGFASQRGQPDAVYITRSTDCGQTFTRPSLVQAFVPYDAQDVYEPEPIPIPESSRDDPAGEEAEPEQGARARDCGDFDSHCESGYTFFRRDTQVRSAGDQFAGASDDIVYLVYDPSKPGTEIPTGTTYGSVSSGVGSQSGVYFARVDGRTGATTAGPTLIDNQAVGHQLFPDISADTPRTAGATGTVLHSIWWDSRLDPCYSRTRPVGNCADRSTVPSLDAWAATSANGGTSWTSRTRLSDVTSNPNYEQFSNRTIPFAGDYLWVTSLGSFSFGVWTDWRDTVQGIDPREVPEDEDDATADVLQCRTFDPTTGVWSGDTCPRAGGLDQNIYGDHTP